MYYAMGHNGLPITKEDQLDEGFPYLQVQENIWKSLKGEGKCCIIKRRIVIETSSTLLNHNFPFVLQKFLVIIGPSNNNFT